MAVNYDSELIKYGDFIQGTCMSMCPEKELLMRERENLLHPFETAVTNVGKDVLNQRGSSNLRRTHHGDGLKRNKADPEKTVKCFSRSAAGQKTPDPSDLRPAPVLKRTVDYLLNQVAAVNLNESSWVDRYQFVADRLRAVRQDMVIQNLPVSDSISILEPIVRFHCFCAYRLCEEPVKDYDPKLNSVHLQECMKRLLVFYDLINKSEESTINQALINQSEMEVLYTTLNLGDVNALTRALERNSGDKTERLAMQLSVAWLCGNYVRVCRLIDTLPVLALCAVATQLPLLRKRALAVMGTAFSSKALRVPLPYVKTILKWSSNEQAIRECRYYGFTIHEAESSITFQKNSLKCDVPQMKPERESWVEQRLDTSDFKDLMFPPKMEGISRGTTSC